MLCGSVFWVQFELNFTTKLCHQHASFPLIFFFPGCTRSWNLNWTSPFESSRWGVQCFYFLCCMFIPPVCVFLCWLNGWFYLFTLDTNLLFLSGFDWVRWWRSCSIHAICRPEVCIYVFFFFYIYLISIVQSLVYLSGIILLSERTSR